MGAYVVVYGEDWTGIYKDGDLLAEKHSFEEIDVLMLVVKHGPIVSCESKQAYSFLELYSLPAALDDVVFDEDLSKDN